MKEDTNKEIKYKDNGKSFIYRFIIIVGISLLFINTNPSYDLHKKTITKHESKKSNVRKEIFGNSRGDEELKNLVDKGVEQFFGLNLWGKDFEVNSYLLFSVGSVNQKGKRDIVSIGVFGMVFVL